MTIKDQTTLSDSKVDVHWKEQYVSEALNRAQAGGKPVGVLHGFNLTPDTGAASPIVEMTPDPVLSDSLAVVLDKADDVALTFRETATQTFDLSSWTGERVWLALWVDYKTGSQTIVKYRIIDQAELGSSWLDEAVLLGSVRVPSGGGALSNGDVEQGSAELAGLGIGGPSRWNVLTENPNFGLDLAGYKENSTSDWSPYKETSDVDTGHTAMVMGRTQNGSASNEVSSVLPQMGLVQTRGYMLVRVRMKSRNISGSPNVTLEVGSDETGILYTYQLPNTGTAYSSYEWFGFMAEIPQDMNEAQLHIDVEFPSTSDQGEFLFDRVEALTRRMEDDIGVKSSVDRVGKRQWVGQPDPNGNNAATQKWAYLRAGDGDGEAQIGSALQTGDPISMTDTNHTEMPSTSFDNLSSVVAGLQRAFKDWHAYGTAVQKRWVSGGTVTSNGNGTVDVGAYEVRSVTSNLDFDQRYYEETTTTTLDVSAVAADSWVYWDPGTLSAEIADATSVDFSSNPEYVVLAYVHWDSGGSSIDRVENIKDPADRLEENVPLTVGDSPDTRFDDLRHVLRLADQYYTGDSPEIVVKGTLTIDDIPTLGAVDLPDEVTIRGHGRDAEIVVADDTNTGAAMGNGDILFLLGNGVTVRDLTVRPANNASVASNTRVFNTESSRSTQEKIRVRDVVIEYDPSDSVAFDHGFFCEGNSTLQDVVVSAVWASLTGKPVHMTGISDVYDVAISDSTFYGGDTSITVEANVANCTFKNVFPSTTTSSDRWTFTNAKVTGCLFDDALLGFEYSKVTGTEITAGSAGHGFPFVDVTASQLSGCEILTFTTDSDHTKAVVYLGTGGSNLQGVEVTCDAMTAIDVSTNGCTVEGCEITTSTGSLDGTERGIKINAANNCLVSGCRIQGYGSQNGVELVSGANYNTVDGLMIEGSGNPVDTFSVSGEVVGQTDGTDGVQSGRLTQSQIVRGTITLTYTNGSDGSNQTVEDNGHGNFFGDSDGNVQDNWIDYERGYFKFDASVSTADGSSYNADITASYTIRAVGVSVDQSAGNENRIGDVMVSDGSSVSVN